MHVLRSMFVWVVVVTLTVVLGVPAILLTLVRPSGHYTVRLGRVWSRAILGAAGVRVVYEGLEHVPSGPCIFVGNHLSFLDVWALVPALPETIMFVAKAPLFRVPILGSAIHLSSFIPVDRRDRVRAIASVNRAVERLRSGRTLVIFAEGTRSRTGQLAPFRKGAFILAVRAQVPIVPFAVSGTGKLMPADSWRIRPGRVRVRFLRPIPTQGCSEEDVPRLLRRTREAIADNLEPDELGPDDRVGVPAGSEA